MPLPSPPPPSSSPSPLAEASLAENAADEKDEEVITDFWAASSRVHHAGHAAALRRFRRLIESTQQPSHCSAARACHFSGYVGGAASNLKRLAHALLAAVLQGDALVGRYPAAITSRLSTNPSLRAACHARGHFSNECYLLPVSPCAAALRAANASRPRSCPTLTEARLHALLDRLAHATGLRSESLAMGTLHAWILRPQPLLAAAVRFYAAALRPRAAAIALHVRKGDKHSLYVRHLKNASYATHPAMYALWARRVAASLGATRALFMSDDPRTIAFLSAAPDGFFSLCPAPAACLPSLGAGLLGKGRAVKSLPSGRMQAYAAAAPRPPAACGDPHFVDDGVQFFAGLLLLAQTAALVGTQLSNVDSVAVELMSTLRHPAAYFDVFNDLHRAYTSDERTWAGSSHFSRRSPLLESLASTAARRFVPDERSVDAAFLASAGFPDETPRTARRDE
ncbi:hypothetical protein AB1Y20_018314 [Prymnesium parvum]|uniref:Protein xylosyltransferase n=1 Tax=Prymnesium parvum TaxID=97485 RepID=A0AB34JPM7_PRYPA